MAAFGRKTTQKNKPQTREGKMMQSIKRRSEAPRSINSQTNQANNSNAFQKKLANSLANLIPVLEAQITKKIEAKYLAKIYALENEIKRVKEEHSSFLYRNGLPTIHENNN